jgi:hypothetical protein
MGLKSWATPNMDNLECKQFFLWKSRENILRTLFVHLFKKCICKTDQKFNGVQIKFNGMNWNEFSPQIHPGSLCPSVQIKWWDKISQSVPSSCTMIWDKQRTIFARKASYKVDFFSYLCFFLVFWSYYSTIFLNFLN